MFSKIINDNTILVGYSKSAWGASTSEISSLENAATFYANATNVYGIPFNVVRIPMEFTGSSYNRTFFAYTNSTILNDTVLVPLYGRTNDSAAIQVYKNNMPGYNVIGVAGGQAVIPMGGSVHCTTMQIPVQGTVTNPVCGNGIIESGEVCDGGSVSCSSLDSNYISGTAACNSACTAYITTNCEVKPNTGGELVTETESGTVAKGKWQLYGYFNAGEGEFKVVMTGTSDADLYVWKNVDGNSLTTGNYACRPYLNGSSETCTLQGPGSFVVGVNGYATSSTFTATITYYGE
jgi:hypothetical protein